MPEIIPDQTTTLQDQHDVLITEWVEHAQTIHALSEQQPLPTTDGRGYHFDQLTFYHGSPVTGITDMAVAEDFTITRGVYGTYSPDTGAIGYALERSRTLGPNNAAPVLYELTASDVNLLDIRTPEAVDTLLDGFKGRLQKWMDEPHDPTYIYLTEVTPGLISEIENKEDSAYARLKSMCRRADLLTPYIEELGFEGIIGLEGGEGEIGVHESWVIFDPSRIAITGEAIFPDPSPPPPRPNEDSASTSSDSWWSQVH